MNNRRRAEIASLLTQIGAVKGAIEETQGQFADILSSLEDVTDEEHESFDTLLEKAQEADYGCAIHDAACRLDRALLKFRWIDGALIEIASELDAVLGALKTAAR